MHGICRRDTQTFFRTTKCLLGENGDISLFTCFRLQIMIELLHHEALLEKCLGKPSQPKHVAWKLRDTLLADTSNLSDKPDGHSNAIWPDDIIKPML